MGKNELLTPKAIANRIKAKGLQAYVGIARRARSNAAVRMESNATARARATSVKCKSLAKTPTVGAGDQEADKASRTCPHWQNGSAEKPELGPLQSEPTGKIAFSPWSSSKLAAAEKELQACF